MLVDSKVDLFQVQLALLTASVKLFIYKSKSDKSDKAKELVYKVLKWATEEVDNPDLRDRGFMYWRLLAINPTVAGEIVLAEKPPITTDSDRMDRGALDQLLLHTGTLGSIYHKVIVTSYIRAAPDYPFSIRTLRYARGAAVARARADLAYVDFHSGCNREGAEG